LRVGQQPFSLDLLMFHAIDLESLESPGGMGHTDHTPHTMRTQSFADLDDQLCPWTRYGLAEVFEAELERRARDLVGLTARRPHHGDHRDKRGNR
jgi:hypothetical protein